MSRFLRMAQEWFLAGAPIGPESMRTSRKVARRRPSRRLRPRTPLTMEPVEPRVLLSGAPRTVLPDRALLDLRGATPAHVSIQAADPLRGVAVVQARKGQAVQLSSISATAVQGGTATITAVLTSNGAPLAGRTVRFQIKGHNVGKAVTDADGVATLTNARTRNLRPGVYSRLVTARFLGDSSHRKVAGKGGLTVSQFATSLGGVSAAGVYGGPATLTATLTANGSPVSGQVIDFQLNGRNVGQARTNAQGVATLGGVSLAGINAGDYANAVNAIFAGGITYQGRLGRGSLAVSRAQATITLGGLLQTYDGTARAVTAMPGPAGLPVTVTYLGADGQAVASPVNAGSYAVNAAVNDPNYAGTAAANLVISPAPVTVGGITAGDKVYDGTTAATIHTSGASLSGVVAGDSVTLSSAGAKGSFNTKDAGTGKTITVTGLTLGGASAGNYVLKAGAATTTADITPAPVTVTGITGIARAYDGTTGARLATGGAAVVGAVPGDRVTVNVSGIKGAFGSGDVGTDKAVSITGVTLAGADAGDYVLTQQPSTTADITPAPLTVTGITAGDRTYDGTTAATISTAGATLSGVVAGEHVTLSTAGATGAFGSRSAGTGKTVTISGLTLGGADAGNYVLAPVVATADITPAALTIGGITAGGKVYNGTAAATIDTSGAALTGVLGNDDVTLDLTHAAGAFADKNAGTGKAVTITGLALAGADAGNYRFTAPTATADITPAHVTVAGIVAENRAYDGTLDVTLDLTGAHLVGTVAGDGVTLDTVDATGSFGTPDVGTGKTVTVTGLALGGADAGNYVLDGPFTATANITARMVPVVGIAASNKVYDGTTAATVDFSHASLTGVLTGQDVSIDASHATATFGDANAGTHKTITITGLALTGADASKYQLGTVTVTADITPAPLTVVGITAGSKVYNGTTAATIDATHAQLSPALGTDQVTLVTAGASGAFADKDAGANKTVTINGLTLAGADAGNYAITPPTTTASITPATLTIGFGSGAITKVYDGTVGVTIDPSSATLGGAVTGDDVRLDTTGVTASFADKDVGTGKAVTIAGMALAGADAGNYTLADPSLTTTGDITPAPLTVDVMSNSNKTYNGTTDATINPTAVSLTGVIGTDDVGVDLSQVRGSFADKNAGVNKTITLTGLVLSGADAGNYAIATATTTGTIAPAHLTVSGVAANDKVYDGTTAGTIDITGASLSPIIGSDQVTIDITGATAIFADKDVGTGKTVTIDGLALSGADGGNYVIDNQPVTTTANIDKATLMVTGITALDKVADGTTAAQLDTTHAGLQGRIGSDDVSLVTTGAVGTFDTPDVGANKTVTITGLTLTGADALDYVIQDPVTTTASITAS